MAYPQCMSWIYKGFNYFGKRHFSKDGLQILNRWLWKWTLIKIKDNIQIKFSKRFKVSETASWAMTCDYCKVERTWFQQNHLLGFEIVLFRSKS